MVGTRRGRWVGAIVAAAVVAAVVAIIGHARTPEPSFDHLVGTYRYGPGGSADVFLPADRVGAVPVVVLVPGGSWRSADRTGLRPLADALAGAGFVAVTASYRVGGADSRYPVPVQDIACAVSFGVHRARVAHVVPGPVVLVGHSAGAQLAALAALGAAPRAPCPYPPVLPDAFVGLSGPYDVMLLADVAQPLFGVTPGAAPTLWAAADPTRHVQLRPELAVLLLHGTHDVDVSPSFTTMFGDALRAAGHPVQVQLVTDADHASIYTPGVSAGRIVTWVRDLSRGT